MIPTFYLSSILSESLKPTKKRLKTDQETDENRPRKLERPTKKDNRIDCILDFCQEPKSLREIMEHIGLHHLGNFKRVYIQPMLNNGKLDMTDPDNPTSINQKYRTR